MIGQHADLVPEHRGLLDDVRFGDFVMADMVHTMYQPDHYGGYDSFSGTQSLMSTHESASEGWDSFTETISELGSSSNDGEGGGGWFDGGGGSSGSSWSSGDSGGWSSGGSFGGGDSGGGMGGGGGDSW
ncbi:hypothetical protein [Enemella dayhoffiae]|uniref:hypothetical protein n=1 Tax=Enemella dayhoffiae TaxID=2016507 RepID=UPI001594E88E|nr:hypothetical protein [Enemella dayhoffiae]